MFTGVKGSNQVQFPVIAGFIVSEANEYDMRTKPDDKDGYGIVALACCSSKRTYDILRAIFSTTVFNVLG